jgi:hypothetical protein
LYNLKMAEDIKDDFWEDFSAVIQAFESRKVDYVLIGGFAVILHGFPRLTRDMDVFIKLVPQNVDRMKEALAGVFKDDSAREITLEDLRSYSVIRYGAPSGFVVDVISNLGEAARFEDLESEIISVRGLSIRVATPETLFKLKKDTLRDKDKADAVFLRKLIEERGRARP